MLKSFKDKHFSANNEHFGPFTLPLLSPGAHKKARENPGLM
jgi:hypothetical protein